MSAMPNAQVLKATPFIFSYMDSWNNFISRTLETEAHTLVIASKLDLGHWPREFRWRIGTSLGEYSYPLADGRGLHLTVHQHHYSLHWDYADANEDPLGHIKKDIPTGQKLAYTFFAGLIADQFLTHGKYRRQIFGA